MGQFLGPVLESAGLGHIKVMVLDDNRIFLPKWVDDVSHKETKTSYYLSGGLLPQPNDNELQIFILLIDVVYLP